MTVTRPGPPGAADLVELICRAVAAGDGPRVDLLLAVLEAVADEAMLRRLTAALARTGPAPHRRARADRPRPSRPRRGGP
jgi:hypothetical protein